ncbi:transcription termination factor NusA [Patescibacteria group bacterium]
MDLKIFASAISQIAEEKGIPTERVKESIETAIAAAYKKDYGQKGQIIKSKLDLKSGDAKFWQIKLVVDESMIYSEEELEELKVPKKGIPTGDDEEEKKIRFNPEKHIMIEEAKKENSKIKTGEELEISLKTQKDYGRIAAQTAKQVILQKIREAEREVLFEEYKSKEGEIISGVCQRIEGRTVFFDIGKILGILPREEQVPGEFYRPGQRLKLYISKVEQSPKGAVIFLSRVYPKIISKLFELEVPEISSGSVSIKAIAREAGSRTKVAVDSEDEKIDPIGSMVGQGGTRVMAVINELGGEKIDIVEWSEDPEEFIAHSLSPAKVLEIKILPKNKAQAIVPEDQLSLAIGKDGQNVRLAAKLTGWKIDVMAPSQKETEDKEEDEREEEEKEEEKEEEDKGEKEKKKKEVLEEKKETKKKSIKKSK